MTSQSDQQKAKKTMLTLVIVVTVVIVASLAASWLAEYFKQRSFQPVSTPNIMIEDIVDGNITVNPSSYTHYSFTVPLDADKNFDVLVYGEFNVSGSSENVIRLYVMDSANFTDWQNTHNADSYYDSGEVNNVDFFQAHVPSVGTYYLVVDNTFSEISKNVTIWAQFDYVPMD